jgi:hypothetical protein
MSVIRSYRSVYAPEICLESVRQLKKNCYGSRFTDFDSNLISLSYKPDALLLCHFALSAISNLFPSWSYIL